ncbi:PQQ-binding-like beta-propeller repeat protein [Calycomorphotria hydatis]|uniref:Outer membrane biogenesis protein BamB n=1 Tax=Calycomorphotria hydatis TaxID=2528027 RepID=A0A517TF04_9PLAN|nr:PQQ-binding-like beta-propeller repeat protein [Calycomorphotria hydatis]QDT66954.1 outer membrane biogenesis protein BamB [Calycomorphotria hydatis]
MHSPIRHAHTPSLWLRGFILAGLLVLSHVGCGESPLPTVSAKEDTAPRTTETGETITVNKVPVTEIEPPGRDGLDWPIFLGPDGTGVSMEQGEIPVFDRQGPPVLWEVGLGTGYSAPSILGNRVVIHHRVADRELIDCLHAKTGERLWRTASATDYSDPYGYNNGPRCTPLVTDDYCYTYGVGGRLTCLDTYSGEVQWFHEVAKEYDLPRWFFGVGCTPVLYGDLLIVLVGGQPDDGVVAFNHKTGEKVWSAVGKKTWDGFMTSWGERYQWTGDEMLVSYSSPVVKQIHGKDHLLCLMRQGLVSLNPSNGKEHFRSWFRAKVHESVNVSRPVVVDDRILLTAAYRVGAACLKVAENGQSYEELWRDPRSMASHMTTPIIVDGYAYGSSGRHENGATVVCTDMKTGAEQWSIIGNEEINGKLIADPASRRVMWADTKEPAPWPYFGRASLIYIKPEQKWVVLGERGTLALAELSPEGYTELARTSYDSISAPSWTAPVYSRGRLYLRDEDTLLCLDLRPEAVK